MSAKKFKPKPIRDQVIVITGASSGIGLATARKAAELGAKVVICSRNAYVLSSVAEDLRNKGADVLPVVADVASLQQVEALRDQALDRYGRIDTWVNNAGISIFGYLTETPLDEEQRIFEVNFWGLRHGCRVAIPILAQNGGVLINLGSEASGRSIPLQGMYAATKHAVKAYTDALRMELEKENIPVPVCLIRPSAIDTPFTLHARNELRSGSPSLTGRVFHPDLVADGIIKCSMKPRRDIYIGGLSRILTIFEALTPRILDRYMERKLFEKQSRGNRVAHVKANEALRHPPTDEGEIQGGHEGRVLRWSLYTKFTS